MEMHGCISNAPRERNLLSAAGIIVFGHMVLVGDSIKNN